VIGLARPAATRRLLAWLVALPSILVGSQVAHALAYRLAYPSLPIRVHMLSVSGHGYLAALPVVFGIVGAIGVCTLGWTAVDAARGRRPQPIPPVAFAALPLLAFTLQEFTERWLAVGGLPWWMFEQPTFRIGLLLQLPFAAIAFAISWLLLRGAVHLGRKLARIDRTTSFAPSPTVTWPTCAVVAGGRLATAWSTRGPPLSVGC
jgi:hypothetical protein